MVLKATSFKSFVVGFGYFANWGDIRIIVYSEVRHIVRRFGYGLEGFLLEALDVIDVGYFR